METPSSVKENSRSVHLTQCPLPLLSCNTAKATTNEPRICWIFLSVGLEKQKLGLWYQGNSRSFESNKLIFLTTGWVCKLGMLVIWASLPHLLNEMTNVYLRVFMRLISIGGNMYKETSVYKVLIRLPYSYSSNLALLSCLDWNWSISHVFRNTEKMIAFIILLLMTLQEILSRTQDADS